MEGLTLCQASSVAHILGYCLPWENLTNLEVPVWARVATSRNGGLDQVSPAVPFTLAFLDLSVWVCCGWSLAEDLTMFPAEVETFDPPGVPLEFVQSPQP